MAFEWTNIMDKYGSDELSFSVPAGKNLKIESTPDGVEFLSEEVPTGKVHNYSIRVVISETNA